MKAEREPKFAPVHLILETQHEVDAMYALFNHGPTTEGVGLQHECYQSLKPFVDKDNSDLLWEKLRKHLKNTIK